MSLYPVQPLPLTQFLHVLENDEQDSGSELWDLEEPEELEELMTEEIKDTQDNDQEFCVEVDIENMPMYVVDQHRKSNALDGALKKSTQPASARYSPYRDRSPIRSSSSSNSSSLASASSSETNKIDSDRVRVKFYSETSEQSRAANQRPGRGANRNRGSRSRGGNRSRGLGDSVWQPGERIVEVCLDDDDVPPRLREMVRELEAARHTRERQNRRHVRSSNEDEIDSENVDSDDEFYDADSSMADELFGGDASALNFQWYPMATFQGSRETFQPERVGPGCSTSCGYEAFRLFWDDCILERIVRETNRHATELKSSSERFARDWYETNVHEIMILFAFWIMLGVIRMPSIKSCYSTCPLLHTGIFKTLMTESRYWILNRALHFTDNSLRAPNSSKLFCLYPIIDHLNNKFKEVYTPNRDVVIDESLALWKSNSSFRKYIQRFGIKTFELCESATGYLWSFFMYAEKDCADPITRLPKSIGVVVNLIKPLLNKGYRVFMNSWFNSPLLARFLKRNRTDCVGILRKSRTNVPNLIKLATIPKGACIARHSGDVVVMGYRDEKTIYTISTCHGTESVKVAGRPNKHSMSKPAAIAEYNVVMGRVSENEQMLEPYLIEHKRFQKWYIRMFKKLLNVSINNSRILVDNSKEDNVKQIAFRLHLVNEIIKRHLVHVPLKRLKVFNKKVDLPEARFVGSHFIVRAIDNESEHRTAGTSRTSRDRRYCVWCKIFEKRPKKTVWMCEKCQVPLCLDKCFKDYHTVR